MYFRLVWSEMLLYLCVIQICHGRWLWCGFSYHGFSSTLPCGLAGVVNCCDRIFLFFGSGCFLLFLSNIYYILILLLLPNHCHCYWSRILSFGWWRWGNWFSRALLQLVGWNLPFVPSVDTFVVWSRVRLQWCWTWRFLWIVGYQCVGWIFLRWKLH